MIRTIRTLIALSIAALAMGLPVAQAADTCTSKCADEEQACIKRTNNKGQCGTKANQCTEKCKKK